MHSLTTERFSAFCSTAGLSPVSTAHHICTLIGLMASDMVGARFILFIFVRAAANYSPHPFSSFTSLPFLWEKFHTFTILSQLWGASESCPSNISSPSRPYFIRGQKAFSSLARFNWLPLHFWRPWHDFHGKFMTRPGFEFKFLIFPMLIYCGLCIIACKHLLFYF